MKHPITAKRIRQALDEANIKQQELADKSGVSKASISQYINGTYAPSNISSGAMAQVLGVSPLWLMGFDVDMHESVSAKTAKEDEELTYKFSLLTSRDKKIVLDMIDSMIERGEDN